MTKAWRIRSLSTSVVPRDQRETPEIWGRKARQAPRGRPVPKVTQVIQVRRDPRGIQATPVPRARKDLKAQRDHKGSLAPKATQESRARQVPRESLAPRAIWATPAPRDSKATKENPEPHILRV